MLDGKIVKVEGYMPECAGYDCTLFSTEKAAKDFWRIGLDRSSKGDLPGFLSIDYDEKFDRKAGPLAGRYVVVTGRVSDECRDAFGKLQCIDRASDLIPIDIAVSRSKNSRSSQTNG